MSFFRLQHEAELKQLEEETARRLEEEIRKRVEEKLGSEEVKLEIELRIKGGQKKLFDDVEAQLKKEKEAALIEARQKEVSYLAFAFSPLPFLFGHAYFLYICISFLVAFFFKKKFQIFVLRIRLH